MPVKTPLFEDREAACKLRQEVKQWLGVPYHHMGETKGGIDCTKLLAFIYVNIGIMEKVCAEYYGTDWCIHSDIEIVLMSFTEHLVKYLAPNHKFELIKYRKGIELFLGDVICMCMNQRGTSNHTAMFMGSGKMIHAANNVGVSIVDFSEYWQEKARFVFRIYKWA